DAASGHLRGPRPGLRGAGRAAGRLVPARRAEADAGGQLHPARVDAVPQLAAVPGAALRGHGGGRRGSAGPPRRSRAAAPPRRRGSALRPVSAQPTLCFFAAPPHGGGVVVEVSPPDADGRVPFREWDSGAGPSQAHTGSTTVPELERRMRDWMRAGWTLGDSVERVAGWLGAHRTAG